MSVKPAARFALISVFALFLATGLGCQPAVADRPAAPAAWAGADASQPVTGILGAMTDEIRVIEAAMTDKATEKVCCVTFITGKIGGRRVALAKSGIGKVNAAITASLLASRYEPREILVSGIAGGLSPDVRPGDIVIAARTVQHDFGAVTEKGFEPKTIDNLITGERSLGYYAADARLLALAQAVAPNVHLTRIATSEGERAPAIRTGTVATGDVFVASAAKKEELRRVFEADAVEMEGAAVAHVCHRFGIPCLVIRSVSDSADAGAKVDMKKFIQTASTNSGALVIELVKRLAAEPAPVAAH
jgi:adenosylhomocysteine nucleosidase